MTHLQIISAMRWTARLLATGLIVFWGAFFVEHTWQGIVNHRIENPPLEAVLIHMLHFLMLASYLVAWKWDAVGGVMIVLLASAFFISVGALQFLPLAILPGVLLLACSYLTHKARLQPGN